MTRLEPTVAGAGEIAERGSRRTVNRVKAVLFAAGLASGLYVGANLGNGTFAADRPWPTTAAILLSLTYVLFVAGGTFLLNHRVDEFERSTTAKAGTFSAGAFILLYPVWFLLWKGGIAPEPEHLVLFILFWLAFAGSSLFYRYR